MVLITEAGPLLSSRPDLPTRDLAASHLAFGSESRSATQVG